MEPKYLQTKKVIKKGKLLSNLLVDETPNRLPGVENSEVVVGSLLWNSQVSSMILDSPMKYNVFIETLRGCHPSGIAHLYSFPRDRIEESLDNSGMSNYVNLKMIRYFRESTL